MAGWCGWWMEEPQPFIRGQLLLLYAWVTYLKFSKKQRSGIFSDISQLKKKNLKNWWQQIKRTTVQIKTKHIYRLDSAPPGHHFANTVLHGDHEKDWRLDKRLCAHFRGLALKELKRQQANTLTGKTLWPGLWSWGDQGEEHRNFSMSVHWDSRCNTETLHSCISLFLKRTLKIV